MVLLNKKYSNAFTIVELLVVIVVIGILAAITIVSYSGITNRANIAAIQAELSSASRKLAIYYIQNGFYPETLDNNGCPLTPIPDTDNCVKFGGSTTYTYVYKNSSQFDLSAARGVLTYIVSENTSPSVLVFNPADWLTLGSQTWAKTNLNVGVMISSAMPQTNNGGANIIEKYCYLDSLSNCNTYGALYLWDEMMKYSSNPDAAIVQGICPAGSHIPTDNDWKVLEMFVGLTQMQADATDYRGTNQGTQLKQGGSSGLELMLAGDSGSSGSFGNIGAAGYLWSSSQSGVSAWSRRLLETTQIGRNLGPKEYGYSVRCLKN